eukprot:TRINITY_DN8758_c0_g1_i2.p1 TRINITY_DN8758_c0_g1~~TRINITY_DN8758_c0_g1_i2.p1  ORF type:complete len:620 (-),score=138.03 TRINITY_DN8758_c0_g1_i2:19-1878(-)
MFFICQRCYKPLDIDPSLYDLDVVLLDRGELELDLLIKPKPDSQPQNAPQIAPNTNPSSTPSIIPNDHAKKNKEFKNYSRFSILSGSVSTGLERPKYGANNLHKEKSAQFTGPSSLRHRVTESPRPLLKSNTQIKLTTSPSFQNSLQASPSLSPTNSPSSPSPLLHSSSNDSSTTDTPPLTPEPIHSRNNSSLDLTYESEISPSSIANSTHLPYSLNTPIPLPSQSPGVITSPSHRPFLNQPSSLTLRYMRSSTKANLKNGLNDLGTTIVPQVTPNYNPTPNDFTASKLFSIATSQSGIDHPLCLECTKGITSETDEETAMLDAQSNSYSLFLDVLDKRESVWSSSHENLALEIAKLEEEERSLRQSLKELEVESLRIEAEEIEVNAQEIRLSSMDDAYWRSFKEYQSQKGRYQDEHSSVSTQIENTSVRLERLKRTNILNDSFHIWHDGHFGTINSFRLGRLPSQPVDWNEINAAWGLATQLLNSMAKKLSVSGFRFTQYRPFPLGSQSKMERIENGNTYELFGSSDISLGRLFWYRRFDNGMVAFLMCLKEMADFAESQDKTLSLPYKMEKDKVGDMSIKIQFNNEETWTKSLKYMLTNLKWLLAWMSKRDVATLEG